MEADDEDLSTDAPRKAHRERPDRSVERHAEERERLEQVGRKSLPVQPETADDAAINPRRDIAGGTSKSKEDSDA